MVDSVNQLEKLAILQLDFDIWSGQVKLDDPDLKLGAGGSLPPKMLASLGRKSVISSEHLKPFNRLKTRARRICTAQGMPFMNGFAIPLTKVDEIVLKLDAISDEMNDLKDNFLSNYDKWVEEWINKYPEYSQAVRAGALPKAKVAERIDFDFQIYKVNPVTEAESKKLKVKADGLADQLLDEVVDRANLFFSKCIQNKETCQSNTQKTLLSIREKVDGLSFLDSRFTSIVELLDKTLSGYAAVGKVVKGEQFYKILSTTLILSSRSKIQDYVDGSVTLEDMAKHYMFDNHNDSDLLNPPPTVEDVVVENKAEEVDVDDAINAFFNVREIEAPLKVEKSSSNYSFM